MAEVEQEKQILLVVGRKHPAGALDRCRAAVRGSVGLGLCAS
jgi:hypothetical protein